jgi:hypothetical protein
VFTRHFFFLQELMNEKMQLIQDNKSYRAAQKDVSVQVKVKFAEFREYQRALAAYKDKLDKVCVCERERCVCEVCV